MGSRLELADGAWADLAAPRKVPERKRRGYIRAMSNLVQATSQLPKTDDGQPDPRFFGGDDLEKVDAVGDALILALVREWSFGEVSQAVLEELPNDAFDRLLITCRDLAADLNPDYGPSPDPKAGSSTSPESPTDSSTAT